MAVSFGSEAGIGNKVFFEDTAEFHTVPMSISFWTYMDAYQTVGGGNWILPLAKRGSDAGSYYVWLVQFWYSGAQNVPIFVAVDATGNWNQVTSNVLPIPGRWYHFVYIISASGLTVYTNGVFQNTNPTPSTINQSTQSGYGLSIGTDGSDYSQFVGQIDDVRIYTRELRGPEIETIYSCKGSDNILYGLYSRWMFNEGYPGQLLTSLGATGMVGTVKDYCGNVNGTALNNPSYSTSSLGTHKKKIS